MIITAHGGALNTGRNTQKYFDAIKNRKIDAIEVDIMKRGKILYLSHDHPKLFLKKAIKMQYVFEFCKQYNLKVNCDVKRPGMLKAVLDLAKEMDATKYVYFTGFVLPREVKYLDEGELYANDSFFWGKYKFTTENLPKIKEYLDSFNNPCIKGININYKKSSITKEFYDKARELGLGLSVYTVDDETALKSLFEYQPDNITTNIVDVVEKLR